MYIHVQCEHVVQCIILIDVVDLDAETICVAHVIYVNTFMRVFIVQYIEPETMQSSRSSLMCKLCVKMYTL